MKQDASSVGLCWSEMIEKPTSFGNIKTLLQQQVKSRARPSFVANEDIVLQGKGHRTKATILIRIWIFVRLCAARARDVVEVSIVCRASRGHHNLYSCCDQRLKPYKEVGSFGILLSGYLFPRLIWSMSQICRRGGRVTGNLNVSTLKNVAQSVT